MEYNEEKGKAVLKQYEKLKAIRNPLDQEYQDCYDYTYPSLGAGFKDSGNDGISNAQTSRAKQARLFDSTATDAVRLLSSSVLSSLTPPNTRWFDLAPQLLDEEELDQDGKEWLEDAAERIHTMIHSSNYDTEALEFTMHQMIAGMAGIYCELKDGKYHFETWPLHHLYCQETLNKGYVDSVYREFNYTAQEAVLEFGFDKLPERIQRVYTDNANDTKMFKFVVCIRPRIKNGKQMTGDRLIKTLPWESLYVADCGSVVKEGGFHEMPVVVPRWLKIPDTDYARGPVFDALPDIKSLNKIQENLLLNMDMHITGMFKVKDDGVINPNTIKFGARRVIPVGDMDNLMPLGSGGDVRFATEQIMAKQGSIRRMLLADQLGPTEKAIQTATEVQTRNNQVRQILGPIFARLQSEFLTHLVGRAFGLAFRANMLSAMPDSLINALRAGKGTLEIEYRSPLARSQKMQELQAIDEMTARVGQVAQTKPEVLDFINFDKIVQKFGDLLAVDPELLNDEGAVKKIRYTREKQRQAMNQQQVAMAQAEAQAKAPAQEPNPAAELSLGV
jgi:hypothetical protein